MEASLSEPQPLTPVGEGMYRDAGVAPDERDRWGSAGFGPHAALNYIRAGASVDDAVAARALGLSSRDLDRHTRAGSGLEDLVAELESALAIGRDMIADLVGRGYELQAIRQALGAGLTAATLQETAPTRGAALAGLVDLGWSAPTARDLAATGIDIDAVARARRDGANMTLSVWIAVVPDRWCRQAWQSVLTDPVEVFERLRVGQQPVDVIDGCPKDARPEDRLSRPVLVVGDASTDPTRPDGGNVPAELMRIEREVSSIDLLAAAFGFDVRRRMTPAPTWPDPTTRRGRPLPMRVEAGDDDGTIRQVVLDGGVASNDELAKAIPHSEVMGAPDHVVPFLADGRPFVAFSIDDAVAVEEVTVDDDIFELGSMIVRPVAQISALETQSRTSGTDVFTLGFTASGLLARSDDLSCDDSTIRVWRSQTSLAEEVIGWIASLDLGDLTPLLAAEALVIDGAIETVGAALDDDSSETLELDAWFSLANAERADVLARFAAEGWSESVQAVTEPDSAAGQRRTERRRLLELDD